MIYKILEKQEQAKPKLGNEWKETIRIMAEIKLRLK
jgi:hypothetical protein